MVDHQRQHILLYITDTEFLKELLNAYILQNGISVQLYVKDLRLAQKVKLKTYLTYIHVYPILIGASL